MKYNKKSVKSAALEGKKVLLRCDFNVPLDKSGAITDDTRITAALPTIKYVLEKGGVAILCSHLGRPKGGFAPELSLKPVAERLSELLSLPVKMAPDCVGDEVRAMAAALRPGEVLLLENLRFHKEERRTILTLLRSLPPLPIYMYPTLSARCTGPTPLPPGLRLICPPTAAS